MEGNKEATTFKDPKVSAVSAGENAENSRLLQYIRVGDPVPPSRLQYPSKTAELDGIDSPRLLLVHRPGIRSIQQLRQDDCLVHLQFGVGVESVAIPDCALQTAKGFASLGDPVGHFIVDLGDAGEGVTRVGEVVHDLQLGAVDIDSGCDIGSVGWRLVHNHRFPRYVVQVEVVAGVGEEVHVSLHVLFGGGV
ncbi:hypothetical protein SprV_0501848200 [Sparganum proliferum]